MKRTHFTRKEFSYNSFERKFTLPENVDAESIAAKYTNGVLKLTLKKTKVEAPKGKKNRHCLIVISHSRGGLLFLETRPEKL